MGERRQQAGEMRRRVESFDWTANPLGPPERWPAALTWSAELIFASGFPMAVRWGPHLIQIYNDAYSGVLGEKHPQAFGRPTREVWPEIYGELGPLSEAILRGERPGFFAEDYPWVIQRHGSREEARFTFSYSPIPDHTAPHGIGGILVTVAETTKRVRNENLRRLHTNKLEVEVEQRSRERDRIWLISEDLLGVSNFDGTFTSVNPAWSRLLGWSDDEIKRMHVSELRHPDDAPAAIAIRAELARGAPAVRVENRFRHRDGSWRWIQWTMTADEGAIYVSGRHVTTEKQALEAQREAQAALQRAQAQLAQAQKMEALGQLTGGVAHDFNNLLTIVGGQAQSLLRRLKNRRSRRSLEAIMAASTRGETLTRQLLTFSRRQPLNPRTVKPDRIVAGSSAILASSVRADINLQVDIPLDVWPIAIDTSEFELALVNLVMNARDAMPQGGSITVSAANKVLTGAETIEQLAGEFVAFTLGDTGSGIPEHLVSKVFDPFFTTKSPGKGTGLGLSQVYGFVRQSGGAITVESKLERGTRMTVYLPRSHEPLAVTAKSQAPAHSPGHGETILVVEDNPDVKSVAVSLLEQLNYRIHAVDCASAALEVLEAGTPIDLVFADVMLPGDVDGLALARIVRERFPGVPVLLTTGYAKSASGRHDLQILRKPYQLSALGEAIRDKLAAARQAAQA